MNKLTLGHITVTIEARKVVFRDARYNKRDARGQHISTYYVATILGMSGGLLLDSAAPEWRLDARAMDDVRAFINNSPLDLQTPIATVGDAESFIHALDAVGKLYHFDDAPETIVNTSTGEAIFTPDECEMLRARVAEMFGLAGFDPFDLALELINGPSED